MTTCTCAISGSGRTQALEGGLLGALRAVEELRALAELAEQSPADIPTLALIDGSLILWSLTGQTYQEFVRTALIDDMFLPAMDRLRELARERPLALAAYVSLPRSADVVNALRLDERLCPYEVANCDMHCGSAPSGQAPVRRRGGRDGPGCFRGDSGRLANVRT